MNLSLMMHFSIPSGNQYQHGMKSSRSQISAITLQMFNNSQNTMWNWNRWINNTVTKIIPIIITIETEVRPPTMAVIITMTIHSATQILQVITTIPIGIIATIVTDMKQVIIAGMTVA
jgi:hypothetical protein